jgi:hypothetical protein
MDDNQVIQVGFKIYENSIPGDYQFSPVNPKDQEPIGRLQTDLITRSKLYNGQNIGVYHSEWNNLMGIRR